MLRLLICGVLITCLAACGQSVEPAAESDVCEEAAQVVADCTGAEPQAPDSCEGESREVAESVVDGGCDALQDSKSDSGFWCSGFVRWLGLCDDEPDSANAEHIAELTLHAPLSGEYQGIADAHGALAIDPYGEPCSVTIHANDDGFTALVDAHGTTEAFVLDHAPDRVVTRSERNTESFADGSGRQFETLSVMVDSSAGTELLTTSIDVVRYDNGNATIRVTNDDTPTNTCTFHAGER